MDRELLKEIFSAFNRAVVDNDKDRSSAEVQNFMTSALLSALHSDEGEADVAGGWAGTTPIEEFAKLDEFHDPKFDRDFRKFSGSIKCKRGGEPYTRPQGWYRYALKVLGKYTDGDAWLGTNGQRDDSVDGEWPVSYHGTSLMGAEGVIKENYKPGSGAMYGRGIYSTPNLSVAEHYAKKGLFKSKNGKRYLVMLQNRINPVYRQKYNEDLYWLIPIPKGTSDQEEKKVMEAIRPYGILVKEV